MSKVITKQQILELIKDKKFNSEEEMENYVFPKISKLFSVKESQVERQLETTPFEGRYSNRADIIIKTDDNFERAMVVIELKLSKSIENYLGGDYELPVKQLYKYCQDVRSPYGILLTDIDCHIFENKFFFSNQKPKRDDNDCLPTIDGIQKKMTFNSFIEFGLCKHSLRYIILIILFYILLYFLFTFFSKFFGVFLGLLMVILVSLLISSLIGLILNFKKVLE